MREKFLTLCIDLEEFNLPQEFGISISREDEYGISRQGSENLYNLLDKFKIRVTFFSNENIAKAFPELLKSLVEEGHEMALHSVIGNTSRNLANELRRQKSVIENTIEKEIHGCRSHKLTYLSTEALKNAGLIYDNSFHPTFVPGRYCHFFSSRRTYVKDEIIRIPISVTPLFRLPFSWVWFRNLGLWYIKFCSQAMYFNQEYINIYFHSWDFANVGNWPLKWRHKFLLRNSGDKMLSILADYLTWCKQEGIKIVTMFEYINKKKYCG